MGLKFVGIAKFVNCIAQQVNNWTRGRVQIVYYQDVPQLPEPLNTLCTIHLNAKSLNLLLKPCLIINFMKLPVDQLMAIPKTVRAFIMMYSRKYNLQSPLHHWELSKLYDQRLQQCHSSKYWVIFELFLNNNERIHADLLILKNYFWELMRIPREKWPNSHSQK